MKALLWLLAVLISGVSFADENDLYTNVYVVPPTFLTVDPSHKGWQPKADPFRNLKPLPPRKTAKQILEKAGITFGEGTSAIYNPATSQVIIRNTQDQMELVEAYIDSIVGGVEKQLYFTVREATVSGGLGALDTEEFEAPVAEFIEKISLRIEKAKNTSVAGIKTFDSFEAFRDNLTADPTKLKERQDSLIEFTAESLTVPKFQLVMNQLKANTNVTFHVAPSVMSRSGQPFIAETAYRRFGVSGVLGADEFTLNLHAFIPEPGKALPASPGTFTTPFKKTIFDGDLALFVSHSKKEDNTRLIFIQGQIMDPAGLPINEKGGRAEKEAADLKKKKAAAASKPDISPEDANAVKRADELAASGSFYMAKGLPTEAVLYYSEALKVLPELPITEPRRKAYKQQLDRAKTSEPIEPKKVSLLKEKLAAIMIPSIDFDDKPINECFAEWFENVLQKRESGLFPEAAPQLVFDELVSSFEAKITLRLENVPASEALRYLCSLGQLRYEIEGETIRILPL